MSFELKAAQGRPQQEDESGKPLLWQQRSPELQHVIATTFETTKKGYTYIFTGAPEYHYGHGEIATTEVLNGLKTQISERPLKVLDVGTGNGRYLKNTKERFADDVIVYGIGAHDMGAGNIKRNGVHFQIADGQRILEYYEPNTFDFICSRVTVAHFIDPLGAIAQMYETLRLGGVLMIDDVKVNGLEQQLPSLIDALKQKKYAVDAEYDYRVQGDHLTTKNLKTLIVKKTHPHLELPITYGKIEQEKGVRYEQTQTLPMQKFPLPHMLQRYLEKMRFAFGAETDRDPFLMNLAYSWINGFGVSIEKKEYQWDEELERAKKTHKPKETLEAIEDAKHFFPKAVQAWEKDYCDPVEIRKRVEQSLGIDLFRG